MNRDPMNSVRCPNTKRSDWVTAFDRKKIKQELQASRIGKYEKVFRDYNPKDNSWVGTVSVGHYPIT